MRKKLSVIFCIREIVYASMVNTELCIVRERDCVYGLCVWTSERRQKICGMYIKYE